jgi:hypothetical protein
MFLKTLPDVASEHSTINMTLPTSGYRHPKPLQLCWKSQIEEKLFPAAEDFAKYDGDRKGEVKG